MSLLEGKEPQGYCQILLSLQRLQRTSHSPMASGFQMERPIVKYSNDGRVTLQAVLPVKHGCLGTKYQDCPGESRSLFLISSGRGRINAHLK